MDSVFSEKDIIYTYTRQDAINDGVIVDISEIAKEMGYKIPVGVTSAVWAIVEKKPKIQDVKGRLWDLLWMLRLRIGKGTTSTVYFTVLMQSGKRQKWTFKAVIAASDPTGNPAITIMLPEED